jgi:hypothetical protein
MQRIASFAVRVERAPFSTSGQHVLRDPSTPGFLCVIGKRAKTWTIQIDVKTLSGRKTHKEAIGRVGEMDYKHARNTAVEKMARLRSGKDKPGQPESGPTLREAWESYRDTHLRRKQRSPRTIEQYVDCLERTLADWLDTPLRELAENPEQVARRHTRIGEKKEPDGSGGPYQANHCMRCLRAVYRHARRTNKSLPVEHPCAGVVYYPETRRESALDAAALRRWWATWAALKNPVRRELHLLTLLSASRRTALCEGQWLHVRPLARVLHQPRPKGGASKAFDIPLSRAMVASLRRLRDHCRVAHDGTPWLFPSDTSKSGHVTEVKENDLDDFPTGHALRATWITQAIAVGVPKFFREVIANHGGRSGDVHDGYASIPALRHELRVVQEKVSRHLLKFAPPAAQRLLSPPTQRRQLRIVRVRRAA